MSLTLLRHNLLKLYQATTERQILRRLEELNQSQWFSADQLQQLQQAKLQRLLTYAHRYVPFYRRAFDQAGFDPDDFERCPETFQRVPVITKDDIRANPQDFITTHPNIKKTLQKNSTSGSTGEPFIFWEDFNSRDYVTAGILRHLGWSGWQLGNPHVYLWGQNLHQSTRQQVRTSLINFALNRFYANAHVLTEKNLATLVAQCRQKHPQVLFGYASALYIFARYVTRQAITDLRFKGIYSTSEVLHPHEREHVEAAFNCKVFDRYSSHEVGGIACECAAHTGLHVSMEDCYLELLHHNQPVTGDQPGEVVVTNLNNYGFPFIRYRLKDMARWFRGACACGRQSPMLAPVQGRVIDVFRTTSGDLVLGDLNDSMFAIEGIRQFQVVQKKLDLILVRIVREESFEDNCLDAIRQNIRHIMGNETQVQFEFPAQIDVLPSGKHRYAISELDIPDSGL